MSIDKSIRQWYASGQLVKKGAIGTRPGFRGPHGSGPGAPSGPSGPSGPPGRGDHHAPSPSPSPRPAPAPSPTPSPHRDPVVTRAPDWVTGGPKTSPTTTPSTLGDAPGRETYISTQYTPTAPVVFDDYNYPGIDKPKIDTGPKIDVGFQNIIR